MDKSIDLNAIAVFVKIVETGSFAAAARLLKMPKTTVSARFAALEAALAASLIVRTTRKLHVTDTGRKYFEHCIRAMRQLEDGYAELSVAAEAPRGQLRVTAPVDIGHLLLPKIVKAYVDAFPDVSVDLMITNRVVDLVGEGVDIAVRVGALKDSNLIGKRFIGLRANVWTTPEYLAEAGPIRRPADLSRLRYAMQGDSTTIRMLRKQESVTVPISGRVKADDFETVRALVKLGGVAGWLPDFVAADDAEQGLLVPALPGWHATANGVVHFVYPGHRYASRNVSAFIETALMSQRRLT